MAPEGGGEGGELRRKILLSRLVLPHAHRRKLRSTIFEAGLEIRVFLQGWEVKEAISVWRMSSMTVDCCMLIAMRFVSQTSEWYVVLSNLFFFFVLVSTFQVVTMKHNIAKSKRNGRDLSANSYLKEDSTNGIYIPVYWLFRLGGIKFGQLYCTKVRLIELFLSLLLHTEEYNKNCVVEVNVGL